MTDVARRVLDTLSLGDLRASGGVYTQAAREEEELLALLPWLQLAPSERSAPSAPAPAPGSLEEILSILPWLEEPDPSPLTGLEGPGDVNLQAPSLSSAAEVAEAVVREPSDQKATPGINAPKILEYENNPTRIIYGDIDAILGDLDTLGAQFFRQPSHAELGWPADVAVPVVVDGEDMYNQVFAPGMPGEHVATDLLALFQKIVPKGTTGTKTADHPSGVVLTMFTGGANSYVGTESSVQYFQTTSGSGDALPCAIEMAWDLVHLHNPETFWGGTTYYIRDYVSADDGSYQSYNDSTRGPDFGWVYSTLDVRSPYKLKYVYYIGYAYGLLLQEVNRQLLADELGYDEIWDSIVGVEIFNEINHSNPFEWKLDGRHTLLGYVETTIAVGARFWSVAVREFVRGLQHALRLGTRMDASDIVLPLWLPSLAMYSSQSPDLVTNAPPTFQSVRFFQQILCEMLVRDFTSTTDASDNPLAVDESGARLAVDFSWFQNQDYHYYSYKPDQSAGPFVRLVAELASLKATFEDVGTAGPTPTSRGGTGVNALAGHPLTISVCETGAAANVDNIDTDVFPYMHPVLGTASGLAGDADRFQAREVWRRLAVAATGARYVAWHTHISFLADTANSSAPFKYLGLRDDDAIVTPKYQPTAGADATQRLSSWAYQRLTELTHSADTLFQGTLVARLATALPSPIGEDYYYRSYEIYTIAWGGIAIHFIIAPNRHAYLLMIDPTAQITNVPEGLVQLTAHARLETESGNPTQFEVWSTIPYGFISTSSPVNAWEFSTSAPNETSVPWFTPIGPARLLRSMTTATIGADSDPILIRCGEPLTVTWVQETP